MPIPTPHAGESQVDYVERAHKALADEFPDTDQRNAVIFKTWRSHKGQTEEEKVAHERFGDDEYQHLQDIPVFKEHSYVRTLRDASGPVRDADGNPIQKIETYNLEALKAIVNNCNRRVLQTKTFAPLTGIHSGKRKPNGDFIEPEVYGFAGPYRLGMYGNEDRSDGAPYKGKWAIYADEFWFRDKIEKGEVNPRERPRRSPEVYVGRPIHDRFLDPITVLGATTPALDMGVHYHLNKSGELVEQYSAPNITVLYDGAAFPGAGNTFVPQPVGEKDKAKYDEDDIDVSHPVYQMGQDDHKKGVRRNDNPFAGRLDDKGKENFRLWAKGYMAAQKKDQYSAFRHDFEGLVAKYTAADPETVNACVNAMLETQIIKRIEQFLDSQDAPVNPKQELEEAEMAGDIADQTGQGTAQPGESPPGKGADETGDDDEGTPPDKKGKDMAAESATKTDEKEKEKYEIQELRREMDIKYGELTARYDQQQAQLADLLTANSQLTTERNQAIRERKIIELRRSGYVFNERDAIAKYSQASEEVFQTWADTVVANAERAPVRPATLHLPALDLPAGEQADDVSQYGGAPQSEVEEIAQYQLRKQQDGEYLTWEEAKEKVEEKREKKLKKAAKTA